MKHEIMEAWTGDEDALLLRLIERHGTSWKVISEQMPNRTVSSMRNRYQRIIRGQQGTGKNMCLKCGQVKRGHSCGRRNDVDAGSVASSVLQGDDDDVPPLLSSDASVHEDADVEDEDLENDDPALFPNHLRCWSTLRTAHDMGFEDVTHPPPLRQWFPFVTSLP